MNKPEIQIVPFRINVFPIPSSQSSIKNIIGIRGSLTDYSYSLWKKIAGILHNHKITLNELGNKEISYEGSNKIYSLIKHKNDYCFLKINYLILKDNYIAMKGIALHQPKNWITNLGIHRTLLINNNKVFKTDNEILEVGTFYLSMITEEEIISMYRYEPK